MQPLAEHIARLSPDQRRLLEQRLKRQGIDVLQLPIVPQSGDAKAIPLSFAQQRLWFLDQLAPGNPFYNIPNALHITGELNVVALEQSLGEVVRRHAVLRTAFPVVDGQPQQVITPTSTGVLSVVDLHDLPESAREAAAAWLSAAEAQRPFDLARGPLWRATILRLGAQEHMLLLTMHHIIADGWSMGLLIREILTPYEAYATGRPSPLPELPIQYADFACWQRQWLHEPRLAAPLAYWRQQLDGSPAILALPTDRPRPVVNSFRGACATFTLPQPLTAALRDVSEQAGVTLFMTLLAAFQTLLYRYTGQDDICVGTAIANRSRVETEGLIGCFANMLVLRARPAGHLSFEELLQQVKQVTLDACAHQELPFERLVEALQPARDLSHMPLFQVMFILHNMTLPALTLSGLSLQLLDTHSGTARFDLTLSIMEEARGLTGVLEYSTDLFEAATIKRLVTHYQTLLTGLVAEPSQRLDAVSLLTEDERQQLLVAWNDTHREAPPATSLPALLAAQVARTAEAVALVCDGEALTYRALDARANRLAHYLRRHGVGPEVRVGVYLERSVELVIGLLGVLKAGGAYVPLDPAYPPARLALILADSQASVLLTQQPLRTTLPAPQAQVVCLEADGAAIAQESPTPPDWAPAAEQLAYVLYTSGSTGQPKGVPIPHRALLNFLQVMQQQPGLTSDDVLLAVTTVAFDIAALEVWLPLSVGARVVLAPRAAVADGRQLLQLLAAEQATVMQATPATWRLLLAAGWRGTRAFTVLCGGEALPRDLAQQLQARAATVWNLYGPTETTVWSAVTRVEPEEGPVPIGRPIANTQLYVLDGQLRPLPIGVPGELYIGGAGVARGYLHRPDLTAAGFLADPYSPVGGARLYRTGDRARYRADGRLEVLGRLDQQVKLRGFRIELGEIEAVLRRHAAVRQAAVRLATEPAGVQRLVAYVVPEPGQAPTAAVLRQFLQGQLPDYMVPTAFVRLDALPLTPNGKVDRQALPALDEARTAEEDTYVAPRTPTEARLVALWSDVLQSERIGIHDNFFALGGHSLLATQMMVRVCAAFQVELPLRALFEAPTVAGLAARLVLLQQGSARQPRPIVPAPRTVSIPLSFAQQRLWVLDQLAPGNPLYNSVAAVRLSGALNMAALAQALNEMVRRHEVLRTTFRAVEGQPVQVIAPVQPVSLSVVDLEQVLSAEQEQVVQGLATATARRRFDLTHGPLLRCSVLRLKDAEHVLVLAMHHIVFDGWSTGVLIREITALYAAYTTGVVSPLPALPVQYVDFAHWQRQWLQGEVLERLLSYWQRQLAGAPPVLELPHARPRPAIPTFQGARHALRLPSSLTGPLKALGQQEGVTLFMTLLAAFKLMLHAYTGRDDIIVGTDVANRQRAELEGLIGFFVNLLVLRTDMRGNPTFRGLLQRVRQVVLDAYAHQDLPFESLVAALQPARTAGHTPIVQVLFVLQNTPQPTLELGGMCVQPIEVQSGTARFEVGLFMQETAQGLIGTWNYHTDLFDASTIARMSDYFTTLLGQIVAQPDARLHRFTPLAEAETKERRMAEDERAAANLMKFKNIRPKPVSLTPRAMVKTEYLQPGATLPAVLQPVENRVDLTGWARSNRSFVEGLLGRHGAILFRGFGVTAVSEFEQFALALCPELFGEYGDLPREETGHKVYHSTPYPPDQAILFHNEASHTPRWPLKQWFFCVQPAQQDGATPIVDCRQIYQELDPAIRQRFEQQQVMYVRNFIAGLDVSWQEFFRTACKATVEETCRKVGIECTWLQNDGLRTRQICPAVARHPKTGEMVFFNQIQLHHVSCLDLGLRASLGSMFGAEGIPRNVNYGDGSPIDDAVVTDIRTLYQRHAVSFPWQAGDILMVDNMLVAHGRQPFVGPRKIVVAMGEMIRRGQA